MSALQINDPITGFVSPGGWRDEPFMHGVVETADSPSSFTTRLRDSEMSAWFRYDEENVRWIRGWHDRNSREVWALEAARALAAEPDRRSLTFNGTEL